MLELIAVIEIGYSNQGIEFPKEYPYWEHAELWDNYNEKCYAKAGLKDKLLAYLPGSSFYKLVDISHDNLIKLTKDHTQEMRNGKEPSCPFSGGYVLRLNGQDKYFPQCCGDLSDIIYWEKLLVEDKPFFYQGHPEPQVLITDKIVFFDFTVDEFDEKFIPPPNDIKVEFKKVDLNKAIEKVKIELRIFANRLLKINVDEDLKIPNIDKILIWGED